MLKLPDGARPRRPLATLALIAINLALYLYLGSLERAGVERFLGLWGVVPLNVWALLAGTDRQVGVLVTPLTSMYLHVEVLHLLGNMLYLWVFGSAVERALGGRAYLLFYSACGLLAAAVQVAAWPDSPLPAVGASGAIAGLLAAYVVLRPAATIGAFAPALFTFRPTDAPPALLLGLWLLSQLLSALLALTAAGAGNNGAWLAHLGGFVGGLGLMLVFRLHRRQEYHW
jgi:rhomboid family protein